MKKSIPRYKNTKLPLLPIQLKSFRQWDPINGKFWNRHERTQRDSRNKNSLSNSISRSSVVKMVLAISLLLFLYFFKKIGSLGRYINWLIFFTLMSAYYWKRCNYHSSSVIIIQRIRRRPDNVAAIKSPMHLAHSFYIMFASQLISLCYIFNFFLKIPHTYLLPGCALLGSRYCEGAANNSTHWSTFERFRFICIS